MNQYVLIEIGQKIRKIRKEKGLTVQTVASRAGVSKGLISRIENNHTIPSVPVLIAIIKSIEVGLNTFFLDIDRDSLEMVVVRKSNELKKISDSASGQMLRYPIIDKNIPESVVKTAILELKSEAKGERSSTNGYAFHYLLSGQISCQIGGETYELAAGDSLYFDTRRVHFFNNEMIESAQMLVVYFII